VQRAVISEFDTNSACFSARVNGLGWFARRCAFENLMPFSVARGEDAFIIAKSTEENRSDLADLGSEILYEWDGYTMVDFLNM